MCPKCALDLSKDGPLRWCSSCGYEPSFSAVHYARLPDEDVIEIHEEASDTRAARSARRSRWLIERKARGVTEHGTRWGYLLGCRCGECQSAYEASKEKVA